SSTFKYLGAVIKDRLTATPCRDGRSGTGISPGSHNESWRDDIIMTFNNLGAVISDRLTATPCRDGRSGTGISPGSDNES
ncbi:hypothetical protein J6590_050287, partial [Homalodisca vitripennis]